MIELNRNSQKAQDIINEFKWYYNNKRVYINSQYDLLKIYGHCSDNKIKSLEKLLRQFDNEKENNSNYLSFNTYESSCMIFGGHNCMMYTCYEIIDGIYLKKHTRYNTYYVPLHNDFIIGGFSVC